MAFILRAFIVCSLTIHLYALDNAHFYRAPFFWGEPRFEKSLLTSARFLIGGGSTTQGRNSCGKITNILNIYGPHAMHHLGKNLTNLNPEDPLDALLINLNTLPNRCHFGDLVFTGKFSLQEAVFDFQQNLNHGFFVRFNMPVRSFATERVSYTDCSPTDTKNPNNRSPEWQAFLNSFDAILQRFGLSAKASKNHGLGDITLLFGFTRNYQETTYADFIDGQVTCGLLLPTGSDAQDSPFVFALPTGYGKFFAIPFSFDASVGLWEWLTIGINSGAVFRINRKKMVRMKTASEQNGYIKLASGCAYVMPGIIWHLGCFAKIDHAAEFFSFLAGYSYSRKECDRYLPLSSSFSTSIVNGDSMLQQWIMHTIHILFEFDFARRGRWYHPEMRFYINAPVGGKQIYQTTVGGLDAGINFSWNL